MPNSRFNQRNVVLGSGLSLDGYGATADRRMSFVPMPDAEQLVAFYNRIDTVIVALEPEELANWSERAADFVGTLLTWYCLSDTAEPGYRDNVHFTREQPGELVRRLQALPGRDIWLLASGDLVRRFLEEDLIDAMSLGLGPMVLGAGVPLFAPGSPRRDFRIVSTHLHRSGLVTLNLDRVRTAESA
ncbi:MAG: dihydrofolate reductase family protein [Acidobacteria bacterium]|nr:dihydrofolate reductase family protein [Acidobacteriota bacterium]